MHVLSPKETSALLSVLRPDTTFEGAAQQFSAAFGSDRSFRVCCGAVLLLEDTALLTVLQRLPLWYILWDVYRTRALAANPFISYLVKAATDESLNPYERCLLVVLLQTGSLHAVCAQTPQGFLAAADVRQLAAAAPDKAELDKVYLAGAPSTEGFSAFKTAALSRVLPDPAPAPAAPSTSATAAPAASSEAQQLALAQQLAGRLSLRGFEPPWQRPVPAVLTPLPGELKWLPLDLPLDLLWDSSMGTDPSNAQVVRDLVSKALRGPLLPAQQQQVLSLLAADPKLVHHIGLTPAQLPALVEFTPVIAYELLLKLMPSRHIGEYFQVLASMEMSLHSMEVVNRLTTAVELPTEFVHLYITNCINSCEGIQDKYMQNRLVRLVCVFLQSLIRNKIINIQDLLHEVQAFCINFSRIREAAGLFRLLKQLEAGGKGLEGMAGADGTGFGHGDAGGADNSISRGHHREGSMGSASSGTR